MRSSFLWVLCWLGLASSYAHAQITLDPIFSDRMVLQREQPIKFWGTAPSGVSVQIQLGSLHAQTRSRADQTWEIELPAMPAGGPYTVHIQSKRSHLILKEIVLGDVWICAGQSNMRWRVRDTYTGDMEVLRSPIPNLRLWDMEGRLEPVNKRYPLEFLRDLTPENFFQSSAWQYADTAHTPSFSAVGYYFGAILHAEIGVPIGLINTSIGGVPVETYLPLTAVRQDARLAPLAMPDWIDHPLYPRWTAERVRQNLVAWTEEAPNTPMPVHPFSPGFLFDAAIKKLLRLPVKGVIWYQGESNATYSADSEAMDADLNYRKLHLLITSWRKAWNNPDLYFFMVQLPAIKRDWESYRSVQLDLTRSLPKTGIAVTLDLGHATDVHPRDKFPVGQRLARLALATAYQMPIVAGGPLYKGYYRKADKLIVHFDQTGQGLESAHGLPLGGVYIAGADRQFKPALVTIRGHELECTHPDIPNPVAVRYAWEDYPTEANLINKAGLPASPFRTDTW